MTAKLMSRLQVLVAIAFAVVALLAPLANAATVYVLDEGYGFGKFDLDGPAAFQYQLINADPGNGDLLLNLATDPTGGFYTSTENYEVGRLSTAGNYTAIGGNVDFAGLSTDSSGTLYGYDSSDNTLGTLDTSTGAFTIIGPSGFYLGDPGMLAFLGANLYAATWDEDSKFYGVNTTTGAFTPIGSPNDLFNGAVLFASPTTLYGIGYDFDVFTIDTATGVPTIIGAVTGANQHFFGAAMVAAPVPEIDPAGLGSVLALIGGGLGLLERRRKRA